jgi:hypothetical protein
MAEDAVDAVLAGSDLAADPCRTRTVPLDGAARRPALAALTGPPRLVRRYGLESADRDLCLDDSFCNCILFIDHFNSDPDHRIRVGKPAQGTLV